jgi:hypothetical protein
VACYFSADSQFKDLSLVLLGAGVVLASVGYNFFAGLLWHDSNPPYPVHISWSNLFQGLLSFALAVLILYTAASRYRIQLTQKAQPVSTEQSQREARENAKEVNEMFEYVERVCGPSPSNNYPKDSDIPVLHMMYLEEGKAKGEYLNCESKAASEFVRKAKEKQQTSLATPK